MRAFLASHPSLQVGRDGVSLGAVRLASMSHVGNQGRHMTKRQQPGLEQYQLAARELIRLWNTHPGSIEIRRRTSAEDRVVIGLAHQTVLTCESVLTLADAGMVRASYPLIRKGLEFSVVAQWLRQRPVTGLPAFAFESERKARALLRAAQATDFLIPDGVVAALSQSLPPKNPEAEVVRRFEAVCGDFVVGETIYTMYRSLSAECHPNISSVSEMFSEDVGASPLEEVGVAYFTCAWSLLLAMRAADEGAIGQPWQRHLQRLARSLLLPSMLRSNERIR